jgi:hypothetical protein
MSARWLERFSKTILASTFAAACAPAAPPAMPPAVKVENPEPSDSAAAPAALPAREPPEASCDVQSLPSGEMIAANIRDTDLTALGEITSAAVVAPEGNAVSGYVRFEYRVDVLARFKGEARAQMRLFQTAEAEVKPLERGTLLFFSACRQGDDAAYEPDVGYFFSVEPGCRSQLETSARSSVAERSDSQRSSACEN